MVLVLALLRPGLVSGPGCATGPRCAGALLSSNSYAPPLLEGLKLISLTIPEWAAEWAQRLPCGSSAMTGRCLTRRIPCGSKAVLHQKDACTPVASPLMLT